MIVPFELSRLKEPVFEVLTRAALAEHSPFFNALAAAMIDEEDGRCIGNTDRAYRATDYMVYCLLTQETKVRHRTAVSSTSTTAITFCKFASIFMFWRNGLFRSWSNWVPFVPYYVLSRASLRGAQKRS